MRIYMGTYTESFQPLSRSSSLTLTLIDAFRYPIVRIGFSSSQQILLTSYAHLRKGLSGPNKRLNEHSLKLSYGLEEHTASIHVVRLAASSEDKVLITLG